MQNFIKRVLNYRKSSKAIHEGKTIHFVPFNGVYVLFRSIEDEIVAIIINKNKKPYSLNLTPFSEIGLTGITMKNIISNTTLIWKDNIRLSSKGVTILTTRL